MVIAGDKSPIPNLSKEPSKTSFGDAALIGAQKVQPWVLDQLLVVLVLV